MFLQHLLHGKENSDIILIQDSLDESGFLLFSAFIKRRAAMKTRVHVFCFENFPCFILRNFNCELKKYVVFHDCYTDPKGYFKETEDTKTKGLLSEKISARDLKNEPLFVFIDSLSAALIAHDLHAIYSDINHIIQTNKDKRQVQVVTLIHKDVLPQDNALKCFLHLARTSLDVTPHEAECSKVYVKHKKSSGKLVEEISCVGFDDYYNIEINEIKEESGVKKTCEDEFVKDMSQLTTFKLDLGSEEKKARSELVLPYIKKNVNQSGEGASIYYEPDERDDWDEDDPDDDLDI